MKVGLFDCFSGASGDMILGALLDAGLSLSDLRKGLASLRLKGYTLQVKKDSRRGISGTSLVVRVASRRRSRSLSQIQRIIRESSLPLKVKEDARAIFQKLGRVESKIHSIPIAKVHFHELGAVDSIVDIVGACYGIHRLGLQKIYFTPLPLGSGWVKNAHGTFPVPSPATVALLQGVSVRWGAPGPGEWTTPTGAAILNHFGKCSEETPAIVFKAVGYGVGKADPKGHPNLLRLALGEQASNGAQKCVWSIQTNVDDMQPQLYGPVMEQLFRAGALDVFLTPIQMKKNRPGTILEVLCEESGKDRICDILLRETTTFGLRMQKMTRRVLDREIRSVQTSLGNVRFKVGKYQGRTIKAVPEFEDAQAISRKKDMALCEVLRRLARYTPSR